MRRINEYYCEIDKRDIICVCRYPNSTKHDFIIYRNDEDLQCPLHVNTDFKSTRKDETVQIFFAKNGSGYDRRIAVSQEDVRAMTLKEIESVAYGAYADGAR